MTGDSRATILDCLRSTATEHGASRHAEYARCPYAHHLAYTKNITLRRHIESPAPLELDYFGVGSLVHAVREWTNRGAMLGRHHDWRDVLEVATEECLDVDVIHEAHRLLKSYYAHYGEINSGWDPRIKVVGVEGLLESPEIGYTGRADAILEIADRIVISDTKTRKSSLPRDLARWTEGAGTNPQFLHLTYAVRRDWGLDYYPDIWLDIIVKTKIPKFQRVTVSFRDSVVSDWLETQRHTMTLPVLQHRNYHACAPAIGSRCWAFDWCHNNRRDLYEQRK